MGFIKYLKQLCEDFYLWISLNKFKMLTLLAVATCGLVLGGIIFANDTNSWWCVNRCNYVHIVVYGSFLSAFVQLLLQSCLLLLIMLLSQLHKYLYLTRYLALFVGCIYAGAHLNCMFAIGGLLGIAFLMLNTLFVVAILTLICFAEGYPTEYRKCLAEIWFDCKTQVITITVLAFARILLLFLLFRPICTLI